jgi:quercetin dioxygenase-like cupin family protein
MSFSGKYIATATVIFCSALASRHLAWGRAAAHGEANERARIVISKQLSRLDGDHLKVTLVEVNYGAGEASTPHSHPCAVIGYVVEGTIRSQVQGEPEMTYQAGESFCEAPNRVHLVSANASATQPAKLLAYLICDHDTPLNVDVSHQEGARK